MFPPLHSGSRTDDSAKQLLQHACIPYMLCRYKSKCCDVAESLLLICTVAAHFQQMCKRRLSCKSNQPGRSGRNTRNTHALLCIRQAIQQGFNLLPHSPEGASVAIIQDVGAALRICCTLPDACVRLRQPPQLMHPQAS